MCLGNWKDFLAAKFMKFIGWIGLVPYTFNVFVFLPIFSEVTSKNVLGFSHITKAEGKGKKNGFVRTAGKKEKFGLWLFFPCYWTSFCNEQMLQWRTDLDIRLNLCPLARQGFSSSFFFFNGTGFCCEFEVIELLSVLVARDFNNLKGLMGRL